MMKQETTYNAETPKVFAWSMFFVLVICAQSVFAQTPTATLRTDSNNILIGDFLKMRLTVKAGEKVHYEFPKITDTLGNLEVISAGSLDTLKEGESVSVSCVYTLSAYDSGEYHAGPVPVYYTNSAGKADTVFSDEILISVNTLDVDTAKPIKAIKPTLEVPYSWKEFIYYYIALAILIIMALAGYVMWREQKKKKKIVYERPKPKDPAHIWARKELKKLEDEKIWQQGDVKLYYSRLTDILRLYLEYRYNWFALESTTEEIEVGMTRYNLKEKAKANLLVILREADLVKFAKLTPLPDANIRAIENAYKFIDFTEPSEAKSEPK